MRKAYPQLGRKWLAASASAFVMSVAVLLAPTSPASAAIDPAAAVGQKRDQLLALVQAGASDTTIQSRLGLVKVSQPSSGGIEPMSSQGDATVSTPTIYYDTQAKYYYASASFSWNNQQTKADGSGGNVGGYDGFAIRFNKDITNMGTGASFCPGNWGGATPYPGTKPGCVVVQPEDNDDFGSSYKYQDKLNQAYCGGTDYPSCWIYIGAKGTIVHSFKKSWAGCLQVYSKYGHTWSSTQISGINVSNGSISFDFSSSSYRWDISSSNSGKLGC
ncbi:hypothetical protein GCM10009661_30650 [Catellatospora chokoriensis]|uniref:Uncharacterized protein n=2 Tax=Micromonosporaceae TaxID=28056 RepID=A0A8J3NQT8_9ACTN|nr:hypothetical protein Cch02nite_29910 [Catellatospora chokoriensis]